MYYIIILLYYYIIILDLNVLRHRTCIVMTTVLMMRLAAMIAEMNAGSEDDLVVSGFLLTTLHVHNMSHVHMCTILY